MTAKLTGEAHRALKALDDGGTLSAIRCYPHPHHYKITRVEPTRAAIDLTASTVDALVTGGLIAPLPATDWTHDRFNYAITPRGVLAARKKQEPEVDDQLVIPEVEHLLEAETKMRKRQRGVA